MRKSEVLAVLSVAGLLLAARPMLAAESGTSDDAQAPRANDGSEGKPAGAATPGARWSHHHHHGRHHHHEASEEGTSRTSGSGSGSAPSNENPQ